MSEKVKILYVDDEPINLEVFHMLFMKKFNVLIAKSGREGLNLIKQENDINLVISDMKMPVMNGLEFINLARAQDPNVIFYILTGFDITEEIERALQQNIIAKYFCKPFDADEIERAIKNSLS